MKSRIIVFAISVLMMSLMGLPHAFCEEYQFSGEISLKGLYVDVDGKEGGKAKFSEYRDLVETGRLFGRVGLGLDSERCYLKFDARDMGYDTQSYRLDGGMWGKFKLDLFYNEIPHNLTFDARTFYSGAGSYNLTGRPNINFNTWNTFDYSIERKQYGGGFKIPMLKPFYLDFSYQREDRDGIKPAAITPGSPGGIVVELPEPVDYTTNNLKVEGGYAKNPFFLSLGFTYSDFDARK